MPRILINGTWYDPVSAASLYEADYEAAILQHSAVLFPGFICVKFKTEVDSEYGKGKPDLALIDHLYRAWYVIEVELDTHSLRWHVDDQVKKFAYGFYHSGHADALCKNTPALDHARVNSMLLGEQPRVLVLVTSHQPAWSARLAKYGAGVGVIELFRDDLDNALLLVNGDQPVALDRTILTECTPEPLLNKALKLHSPAPFEGQNELDLLYEGHSTRWQIIRVKDAAWLTPTDRITLPIAHGLRWVIRRVGSDLVITEGARFL